MFHNEPIIMIYLFNYRCGCKLNGGEPCYSVFTRGNDMMEMIPRKCFNIYIPMISKHHVVNITLFKFLIL